MAWRVDKLWKKEWPEVRNHWRVFVLEMKAGNGLTHNYVDLFVEGLRFVGRTITSLAYTIGHILALLPLFLLAGYIFFS